MSNSPGHSLAMAHLRIARPTDRLDDVVAFYKTLGFSEQGRFVDHEGFDGVMLGHVGSAYHLEFTHAHGHPAGDAPTKDHLLVFYVPDAAAWRQVTEHLAEQGHAPVRSFNPYWEQQGQTYEDPDGYRIVIQNSAWPPVSR